MQSVGEDDFSGMRVLHAASYNFDRDASVFFNCTLKIHHGMVRNGCYVYPFSVNDRARMLSFTNSRRFGERRANRSLVKSCLNMNPDALILGHAQAITRDTLLEIRDALPNLKIGFWYIDPLWNEKDVAHIHKRADLFDAICCTTSGDLLRPFSRRGTPAAFIPNPVDAGIERYRAFEEKDPKHDLVFFGRDKYASRRGELLSRLVKALPDFRFGIFGSLGQPLVFGHEKEKILASSRMALNLSRRDDVELYSSDRIAQLTGNGILTLTATGAGIEQLYSSDEIAYYGDFDELVTKVRWLKQCNEERVRIARNGWTKSHSVYSAQEVARFIINLTMRFPEYRQCPWSQHIYWHASDISHEAAA
ncbi:MAG: glycosyltransferase family 1 protein [Planctomycetaceae bacterium]|nr:glycosyltransferase family 1 protein [Planctomycetaceae bacterium]